MHDGPDRSEEEVTQADVEGARPGPASGQVRIIGAHPAGELTAEIPAVSAEADRTGTQVPVPGPGPGGVDDAGELEDPVEHSGVRVTDQRTELPEGVVAVDPVAPGETAMPATHTSAELPHWTDAPTGQVPAVLARDPGDAAGAGSGIMGPTWREEDADWVAHEEEFEPAMFGGDQEALGSLNETDSLAAERRPWEFDLESPDDGVGERIEQDSAHGHSAHPMTEPIPAVRFPSDQMQPDAADRSLEDAGPGQSEPTPLTEEPVAVAPDGMDPPIGEEVPGGEEGIDASATGSARVLPTGIARPGRARRGGLRPARLRAKRPDDAGALVDAPLAAEPPGASVTDVPGVGLKRGGVVGLAAADRSAERLGAGDQALGSTASRGSGTLPSDTRQDNATSARERLGGRARTRPMSAGAPRSSDDSTPTGGGPPRPRRSRPDPAARDGRRRPEGSSFATRVGTGIAVALVALVAFKLGTVTSLVLVVVVVTFAAGECFGVLRRAGYHPATLLGLVGTVSLVVGAYTKGVAALPLVMVLITAFTLVWYLFGIETGSPVAGTAATMLTIGWVSLLGAYAGLLLSPSAFPDRHGIAFLLGAVIATVANDVGALVVGRWLGSRPLAPTISPNKTWEGLLGGTVFSILVSTVAVGYIHPWSPANAALLGVVVSVVAPIGDLCESLLKRDLRIKDMGTLLPGHGGVLDRVDALLFVLPATYYLVRALNIG